MTDAKVMTKDGVSRRFGFVGYPTEKQAKAAKKHFDQTYMDTSKLIVEIALKAPACHDRTLVCAPASQMRCAVVSQIGDEAIPRPWSKYSEGSSAHLKRHPIEKEAPKKVRVRPRRSRSAD